MAQYTRQEILDKTAEHLFKQGCPAKNDEGDCFYRFVDDNGNVLMCAVGALIPDEMYLVDFEDRNIHSLLTDRNLNSIFNIDDLELLRHVQLIHDSRTANLYSSWFDYLTKEYVEIAEITGLKVPSVVIDYINNRKGE